MNALMKRYGHWLALLALALVLAWHLASWRKAENQDRENRDLRGRIEAANEPARTRGGNKSSVARGEWREVATRMVRLGDREELDDLPEWLDLLEQISEMSTKELLGALDEVASGDLDADARELLEEHLARTLIEKDPRLALESLAERIGEEEGGVSWQLSAALGAWARQDPAGAAAWMDRQIAQGRFESKSLDETSTSRIEFEGELIEVLLDQQPDDAGSRLEALPADERRTTLEQVDLVNLSPSAQVTYANLMRQTVPPEEQEGLFSQAVSELLMDGGLPEVADFMNRIEATPQERADSSKQAAGHHLDEIASERPVTMEDLHSLRNWIGQQAGGPVERIAGESLAEAARWGGEFTVQAALDLAMDFHLAGGDAELPRALISSLDPEMDEERLPELLQRLANPQERQSYAEQIE